MSFVPNLALKGRLDCVKLTVRLTLSSPQCFCLRKLMVVTQDLALYFLLFTRLETLAITDTQRMFWSYLALFKEECDNWPDAIAMAHASHPGKEQAEDVAMRYLDSPHGALKALSFLSYPLSCNEKEWTFHLDGDNVTLNAETWTLAEAGPGVVRVPKGVTGAGPERKSLLA